MLFTVNRIKACRTGYKSELLQVSSLTKRRNQEKWDLVLSVANEWLAHTVCGKACNTITDAIKEIQKNGILDVFSCQIMGSFLLAIVILNT